MQPKPIAVKATRGLGITQIIVGSLMLVSGILSIALVDYWQAMLALQYGVVSGLLLVAYLVCTLLQIHPMKAGT